MRIVIVVVAAMAAFVPGRGRAEARNRIVDVNGDGKADVVATEIGPDDRVVVYFGSATGLAAKPDQVIAVPDATTVVGLGDVNGDKFGDVLVATARSARVFVGSAAGLKASPVVGLTTPDGEIHGVTFVALGDVNGDGLDDIGAVADCHPEDLGDEQVVCTTKQEHFYVWNGSKTAIAKAPATAIHQPQTAFVAFAVGVGDVDGDSIDDVMLRRGPVVELFLGRPSGLSATPAQKLRPANIHVEQVAAAGDVNGDGRDDIAMIGTRPRGDRSWVFVHLGTKRGVSARASVRIAAVGGHDIASAGDIDGDGKDDLVLGENERVVVRRGTPKGVAAKAIAIAAPSTDHDHFGYPSGSPGDIDGDGKADLVLGAPVSGGPIGGVRIGHVFVYRGGALAKPWADLTGLGGARGGDFGGGVASTAP